MGNYFAGSPDVDNRDRRLRILTMFFVYILYAELHDRYYVGQTSNIEQRLNQHNEGLSNYTSRYKPWKLVCLLEKETRKEAILLERKLKNLAGDRLKQFISTHPLTIN